MVTPYDRVKSAWDSGNRRVTLNRVVEEMAAEGASLDTLDAALGRLLDEVRATGADDETEEIINSVGDRLHGWCHESRHITTRPAALGSESSPAMPHATNRLVSWNKDYAGREQSQVKHFILEKYLQRFAHIIGSWADTIAYIDCFSGPWKAQADDLSDTSFAIALRELRKARDTHASRGKSLSVRCMFLEKDAEAFARLKSYADQQHDVVVEARNTELTKAVPDILQFIRDGGANTFPFFFIDPTGWSGCDMDDIAPLLRHRPGEVLINFMTLDIRRHIEDNRPGVRESFRRFFGTDAVFVRLRQLYGDDFRERNPQDVEDELFTCYADCVREVGQFNYTCPAVVLHSVEDRTYYHLIYATRHRKGVEVFKDVEKKAFEFQNDVRAEAEERKRIRETGQPSLFAGAPNQPPTHRAVTLRERYLERAQGAVGALFERTNRVPFDEIWDSAMRFPLVWESDVKEWVADWVQSNWARVLNLKPGQRVPQWGEGHVIERPG